MKVGHYLVVKFHESRVTMTVVKFRKIALLCYLLNSGRLSCNVICKVQENLVALRLSNFGKLVFYESNQI